jgi:linoleoyl-CoA desaturase
LKFGGNDGFHLALRRRVDRYFRHTRQPRRDCPRMYLKTGVILSWLAATYVLLLFFAGTGWLAIPLAVLLGLAMAAVGFNIQHDGGHGAYSERRWVNKLMSLTLDLLGGSSYIWARKHNSIHHSYTNVTDHDDDINIGWLGRLTPHQRRLPFHRLQHWYLWALYGFLPAKWYLWDDFRDVGRGRIGGVRIARPRGWELVTLLAGKAAFFLLAFAIPALLHPIWIVLVVYAIATFVQGVVLSIVFQLAHCVEEATFPLPHQDTGRIEKTWAVHQVETTVDFARRDRLVSWYTGGLNFQVVHHLFPQICHVHYARMARIVEKTCRKFGVEYRSHATLWAGIASHFRWLRRMGMAGAT